MTLFRKKPPTQQNPPVWTITRDCLNLILECAKSNYPNEFGGFLSIDPERKTTIAEVVILPGTISGDSHAIFKLHMLPIDYTIVGTVHSHPSCNPTPSQADLHLFAKHGKVHIIVAHPYTETTWKAYTYKGEELEIPIV